MFSWFRTRSRSIAGAALLALRYYGRELTRPRRLTVPAMVLFALGGIGLDHIAQGDRVRAVGRSAGTTQL